MAFIPIAMMAYDAEIDGIYYNVVKKAGVATVTSGDNPYTGEVVIPETFVFEGKVYTVKSIGDEAFSNCSELTSVDIPEGVTSIGSNAFNACVGITSLTIPSTVTSIGDAAFCWCSGLTSINIPDGVTSLGTWTFIGCSSLANITFPLSLTSIGYEAFAGCGLTNITIPESVTSVGDFAFRNCGELTSVAILSNVLLGTFAFQYCSNLTSVTVVPGTALGHGSFSDCNSLETINVLVTDYASFCSRSGGGDFPIRLIDSTGNEITEFLIPEGVTSINGSAFYNCTGLTSVIISEGVTSIGGNAFHNCSSLTTIAIPSSVASIDDGAITNCESLEVVTCYAPTVPSTNTNAFDGSYTEYATLIVPDEALSDYQTTAPWSNFGTLLGSSQAAVVTANSYTREYGEPNPAFEYTSDIPLDGTPSITCTATEISAPGVYPIVITQGTETNAGLIYVDGTLTITKAPLTITAKSYTINEGDAMPTFEVEYDGFKNDETADDLTSQPTISCTASDTYTEGIYDITVSGAASDNYDISYVAGKLTVAPTDAHITITSAGMGTYCSPYDLDFTGVTDLKAYTITGYDKANSRVYATRVYDVPAGTGLYLVGNPGDYDVPISTSNSYYINMLVGTLEQTWIDTTDGDLTNLRLTGTNPSNASFKILSEGRNFSANRAYLQIPTYILGNTANAATAFGIVLDDDTNGIEDIMLNPDDTDSEWYTLDGRKLNGKPTARGIYVVKGRKVVVK